MASLNAFVWHDLDGNITAVGYASGDKKETIQPMARENRRVLKLRVAKSDLKKLHLTHRVNIDKAKLSRRKDDKAATAE